MTSPTNQPEEQIVQALLASGRTGLALDVDETLSITATKVISELQQRFGNPENLTVAEVIARYDYIEQVPYWQSAEAKNFINSCWRSPEFQHQLEIIEGALEHVHKIHQHLPILVYLTARPGCVTEATAVWLQHHGFPEASVICRPDELPSEQGSQWKAQVLARLYPAIVGIVDDNRSLIRHLPADYPGTIYLFNNQDPGDHSLTVIQCQNWAEVHRCITEQHSTID